MVWEVEGVVVEEEERERGVKERDWEREVVVVVLVGLRNREEGRVVGGESIEWRLGREWWWWRDWRELVAICGEREMELWN